MEITIEEVFNKELELLNKHAENLEAELKGIKEQIANLELLKNTKIELKDNSIKPIATAKVYNLIEEDKKNKK